MIFSRLVETAIMLMSKLVFPSVLQMLKNSKLVVFTFNYNSVLTSNTLVLFAISSSVALLLVIVILDDHGPSCDVRKLLIIKVDLVCILMNFTSSP